MAYTPGTHRADSLGVNGGTSGSIDTSGNDIVWLGVATDSGVTLVAGDISDSKTNTYVLVGSSVTGGFARCHIFVVKNATVGAGHTFTVTKSSCYAAICAFAASGSDLSAPTDQTAGAGTTGTSIATGSVTPTTNDQMLITVLADDNGGTATDPSGYTRTDRQAIVPFNSYGITMAYLIQTTAAASNPSWSVTLSTGIAAIVGTFKSAAGGATGWGPLLGLRNNRLVNQ